MRTRAIQAYYSSMSQRIIYLDFDGVLHPEAVYRERGGEPYLSENFTEDGHRLFEHAEILSNALKIYPDVKVVLSTSWVLSLGLEQTKSYLPLAISNRVIGSTYDADFIYRDEFSSITRGQQVLIDVARRRPASWLAIDDDSRGWSEEKSSKLVLTHPVWGISHEDVLAQLTTALAVEFGGGESEFEPLTDAQHAAIRRAAGEVDRG